MMQSKGIRELMDAEREADKLVKDARKKKNARLKAAVEEARRDVDTYKKEREGLFQEQQLKSSGSRDDFCALIDRDTEEKLNNLKINVAKNRDKVIEMLIDKVFDIKAEVHENLKFDNSTN